MTTPSAFRTVLTHVIADDHEAPRLHATVALARKLDATLYGLAAEMVPPTAAADGAGVLTGDWYAALSAQVETNLADARRLFEETTAGLSTQWASVQAWPGEALVRASRAADLIVMGGRPLRTSNGYRNADPIEVMMHSGRPILIAPPSAPPLRAKAVVVAWKDTREARRRSPSPCRSSRAPKRWSWSRSARRPTSRTPAPAWPTSPRVSPATG
jgi:hypothetical protein